MRTTTYISVRPTVDFFPSISKTAASSSGANDISQEVGSKLVVLIVNQLPEHWCTRVRSKLIQRSREKAQIAQAFEHLLRPDSTLPAYKCLPSEWRAQSASVSIMDHVEDLFFLLILASSVLTGSTA